MLVVLDVWRWVWIGDDCWESNVEAGASVYGFFLVVSASRGGVAL
jgi:hypothetical protein